MKRKIRFLTLVIMLALVLVPTSAVFAQGPSPDGGKVVFGDNVTLESGQTFDGDLVVFGGNVTIEEDAKLNGNLIVFGGTISSDGTINGDLVIFGGQIKLNDHAIVDGDVVTVGGQLDKAAGAEVRGDVVDDIPAPVAPSIPSVPDVPAPTIRYDFGFNFFGQVFQVFFWATIAAGFAMLLSLFWKPQMERAGNAVVTQPVMVGAVGLLALVVGALLLLTIIPPLLVGFAWLFGIVAFGSEVGDRFTKAINQTWSPVLTVGAGTFLLVLVSGAFGFVPCLGGLAQFMLGLLAIGSVVITRFGARPIQSSGMIVSPTPPASES